MLLENYRPKSRLVTKESIVKTPRFPVIDVHNHLGDEFGGGWIHRPVNELIDVLDQAEVKLYVDLDGGWGEDILKSHVEKLKHRFPNRFRVFGGVDWKMWKKLGNAFPKWAASRLKLQQAMGADGVKIWKNFGLHVRDANDDLVNIDDPRLDIIWHTAAELHLPVMLHVADPVAFFDKVNETNERWEELNANPAWQFTSPPYPTFISIIESMANLIKRHPKTIFIGAHVGCYAENLNWVAELMDQCPNYYVDFSARIGELGRQPYSARRFFVDHSDKILFGSDFGPNLDVYRIIYRFLESDDEYFNYSAAEIPKQGRWYIYGIHLPDDVLKSIYFSNAEKLFMK